MAPEVLRLAEVDALSRVPHARARFSPLGDQPWLLLDAELGGAPAPDQARIAEWLRALPCPVLGLAAAEDPGPVAAACDVRLESADEAPALIARIQHAPIAAGVLVQLLRATETLDVEPALVAESLAYATLQAGPEFAHWLAAHEPEVPAPDEGPPVDAQREGDILRLVLNRPSSRNAMSVEMRDALVEALQLVLADETIREVRFSARGKCFSTGGELAEFGTAPDPATAHAVRQLAVPGRLLAQCGERVHVRVHGACVGSGIEFPAFARHITAARDAWFQLPELEFGLIPGAGGCVSIARRIGRQRTALLALSGKRITAVKAADWGLVDAIEE